MTNNIYNKVAVITGAHGMDSRTLTHFLIKKNYTIILTKRNSTSLNINNIYSLFYSDLKENPVALVEFADMDITDAKSVDTCILSILEKYGKIDEFYSLAAQSHVGDSFNCPELTLLTNGTSNYYILESLKNHSPKTRYYFANTSECFGGDPKNCPFREVSPLELRSPYSISKNLGANITRYYRQTHNMHACFGWLFNHSNIYRKNNFYFMKVIRAAARISCGKEENVYLGNLNFWRDEHLSDFGCEMMWKMLNNPKGPKDYVIGNGTAFHGEEYLDYAFNYFNLNWKNHVKFDDKLLRPNEVTKLLSDPTQAMLDLDWKPNRISLKQHIEYVADYVIQEELGQQPVRKDPFELFPIKKY